jgi:putative ABC transport system substrate-binding protein
MRRREFISLLGGTLAAWPLTARAQRPDKMPVVGFLNGASAEGYAKFASEFRRGLHEMGFVEGQNVVVEYHWANGEYKRLPEMAAELARRPVTVIAATSTPAALAAKMATTTIPTVFTTASDPVALGFVANLGQPGGNMTGATQLNIEVAQKRLELLHQLLPKASTIALLINPSNPAAASAQTRDVQAAAPAFGLQVYILQARTEAEFDSSFARAAELRVAGLVIAAGDPFFNSKSASLAAAATRHAMPAIYEGRDFVAFGGLISYGGSVANSYHLAGIYTGRILRGEKPSDLPVQRSTKVEMYINLKTARALGIAVPQGLVISADEVIE